MNVSGLLGRNAAARPAAPTQAAFPVLNGRPLELSYINTFRTLILKISNVSLNKRETW
jgi:hypothetical protein